MQTQNYATDTTQPLPVNFARHHPFKHAGLDVIAQAVKKVSK